MATSFRFVGYPAAVLVDDKGKPVIERLLGSIFLLCFVSFICWLFFIGFKGEAAKDANRLMLALNISSAKIQ